jgi:hypothetical protein
MGSGGGGGPPRSSRDRLREKKKMLRRIQDWHSKGIIKNDPRFTVDTPYEEIEDEYEACMEDKRRKDSLKLQQWWIITAVNTIEYANSTFNPFDLNLDGWGEQISEDIDSYEDILVELHEKYKGGKMAPEVQLLMKLVFSAVMINVTNKALSSSVPSVNDILRQSPDLLRAFTNSAVETMNRQDPMGGAGFMSSILQSNVRPPPPMETQGPNAPPPPPRPGSMGFTPNISSRPDLAAARGMGINTPLNQMPAPMFRERGVNVQQSNEVRTGPDDFESTMKRPRREMTGPAVSVAAAGVSPPPIDHFLSSLAAGPPAASSVVVDIQSEREEDSVVSIASLKDLQASSTTKMPKAARKRKNAQSGTGSTASRPSTTISLVEDTSLSSL